MNLDLFFIDNARALSIEKYGNFLKTQHSMDATEHIFLGYAEALKRFLAERRQ
jgi:hypothetical protein